MEEVKDQPPYENGAFKAEFAGLLTLEEKLEFWRTKLGREYIFYLMGTGYKSRGAKHVKDDYYEKLKEFEIVPSPDQLKEYNIAVLKEYELVIDAVTKRKALVSADKLKADFIQKVQNTKNQKQFIVSEIDKLKREVAQRSQVHEGFPYDDSGEFFKHAYELMFYNEEAYDISRSILGYQKLIALHNGQVYAEYHRFLEDELENLGKKKPAPKKVKELSITQQILILDYLGFFKSVSWEDKSKLSASIAL
jgi:hypothetical protein